MNKPLVNREQTLSEPGLPQCFDYAPPSTGPFRYSKRLSLDTSF